MDNNTDFCAISLYLARPLLRVYLIWCYSESVTLVLEKNQHKEVVYAA
jgi:hypothetical protein